MHRQRGLHFRELLQMLELSREPQLEANVEKGMRQSRGQPLTKRH